MLKWVTVTMFGSEEEYKKIIYLKGKIWSSMEKRKKTKKKKIGERNRKKKKGK